ncbi:MAG: hypothetical protein IKC07_03275 [Clostridia bacterium]|nr:hypothetical protein [Clostridia bacterium]
MQKWAAEITAYGLSFLYYSSLVADAVVEMKEETFQETPAVATKKDEC